MPASAPPPMDILDLLGRAPVNLDTPELQRFLAGKTILVSGAGGSIGSEICRQAMKFCPRRLLLLDRAENSLFEIDRELNHRWVGADIVPLVADICDRPRIEQIFNQHQPDVVFHCAAHKHVPMMEANPGEAVKNNVLGTRVIADAAQAAAVGAFVMVSTDKAVNPTSVMGATKRCAELYIQSLNEGSGFRVQGSVEGSGFRVQGSVGAPMTAGIRAIKVQPRSSDTDPLVLHPEPQTLIYPEPFSPEPRTLNPEPSHEPSARATRFVAVRFGNVLGSSGSVVPIFRKQIEAGGPVTVTHPDMKRYFMTIPEASQLVMQAGAIGQGGEIFVLDMGEPMRILDLAREMICRSGLRPDEDIAIQFSGIRPGEKLYEELALDSEETVPTSHEKIRVWQLPRAQPRQVERMMQTLAGVIDARPEQVIQALRRCVAEYRPSGAAPAPVPAMRLAPAA